MTRSEESTLYFIGGTFCQSSKGFVNVVGFSSRLSFVSMFCLDDIEPVLLHRLEGHLGRKV